MGVYPAIMGRPLRSGHRPPGDILSIIPLFFSGIPFRFGRDRWGGGFLLTHPVSTDRSKDVHEKDKTLALLDALKIPVTDRELELHVPKAEEAFVERFLRECEFPREWRIVTVAPAALYSWKAWSPEKFAELLTRLGREISCSFFVIGGPEDKEILDGIAKQSEARTINCSGRMNLCQTAALLRRSDLFIGNDSGLSHIAAAVKTPLIQLFGPGEPEKFGHTGPGRIVIQRADCPHHPCQQRDCITPGEWCMNKIAVGEVLAAARRLLGSSVTC